MTAARKATARKAIPANAPKPQDRKPRKSAAARQAEADGFAVIEQCGLKLRIDLTNLPIKAMLRFQGLKDDLTEFDKEERPKAELLGTRELLGAKQWEQLLAKDPGTRDFQEISDKFVELLGLENQGN